MFNVSALLLDDTLLKCVVTEVVLFSIVAFKTLTFHEVVQRHTWCVLGSLVAVLLEMFSWFWQWNKFENWSTFDEVEAYEVKAYKTKLFGQPAYCIYSPILYCTVSLTLSKLTAWMITCWLNFRLGVCVQRSLFDPISLNWCHQKPDFYTQWHCVSITPPPLIL